MQTKRRTAGTLGCDNNIRDLNILKLNQQRLLAGFSNKIVVIRGRSAARCAFYTSVPVGEAREMPKRRSTGDHSYLQTASPSPLLLRATTRKTNTYCIHQDGLLPNCCAINDIRIDSKAGQKNVIDRCISISPTAFE